MGCARFACDPRCTNCNSVNIRKIKLISVRQGGPFANFMGSVGTKGSLINISCGGGAGAWVVGKGEEDT